MSIRARTAWSCAIAVVAVLVVAAPAAAQADTNGDPFVVITGTLEVRQGQTVGDAVIFNGDAIIDGQVQGSVTALNGDITVSGSVDEDVVAVNGRVTLEPGAHVGGNIMSRRTPVISQGATLDGRIRQWNGTVHFGNFLAGRFAAWVATTVSSFLLGLIVILFAPRAADAVARAASARRGASIGYGALMFFAIPIAAVVALVTLVGIPLGIGILLALGLVYWLGYTGGAFALGRALVKPPRHRLIAFLAGWAILRIVALIPIVGGLVWLVTAVWGLGALTVAARAAGREESKAAGQPTPVGALPTPPPPPPPAP